MTTNACSNNTNLADTILRAKQITFDTSILKHTVMKVFSKQDSPFICPNKCHPCSNCAIDALAQCLSRFENRSASRRKSA